MQPNKPQSAHARSGNVGQQLFCSTYGHSLCQWHERRRPGGSTRPAIDGKQLFHPANAQRSDFFGNVELNTHHHCFSSGHTLDNSSEAKAGRSRIGDEKPLGYFLHTPSRLNKRSLSTTRNPTTASAYTLTQFPLTRTNTVHSSSQRCARITGSGVETCFFRGSRLHLRTCH